MYHKQKQFHRIGEWGHRNKNLVKTPIAIHTRTHMCAHTRACVCVCVCKLISVVGANWLGFRKTLLTPNWSICCKECLMFMYSNKSFICIVRWETFHINLKFTYPLNKHQIFLKCIKYFSAFLSWLLCYLCFFWLKRHTCLFL